MKNLIVLAVLMLPSFIAFGGEAEELVKSLEPDTIWTTQPEKAKGALETLLALDFDAGLPILIKRIDGWDYPTKGNVAVMGPGRIHGAKSPKSMADLYAALTADQQEKLLQALVSKDWGLTDAQKYILSNRLMVHYQKEEILWEETRKAIAAGGGPAKSAATNEKNPEERKAITFCINFGVTPQIQAELVSKIVGANPKP